MLSEVRFLIGEVSLRAPVGAFRTRCRMEGDCDRQLSCRALIHRYLGLEATPSAFGRRQAEITNEFHRRMPSWGGPRSPGFSPPPTVPVSRPAPTSARRGCCGIPGATAAGCSCKGGRSHRRQGRLPLDEPPLAQAKCKKKEKGHKVYSFLERECGGDTMPAPPIESPESLVGRGGVRIFAAGRERKRGPDSTGAVGQASCCYSSSSATRSLPQETQP